jgi:uncharacterized membrane protein (DUF485 family)
MESIFGKMLRKTEMLRNFLQCIVTTFYILFFLLIRFFENVKKF